MAQVRWCSLLALLLLCAGCIPGEHPDWEHPSPCAQRDAQASSPHWRGEKHGWLHGRCPPTADAGSAPDGSSPTACAAPTYRPDEAYLSGDRVVHGGRAYACTPPSGASGCATCSVAPPAPGSEVWQSLATCAPDDASAPDDRAVVDGYYDAPRAFLLPAGSAQGATWQYTSAQPAGDWTAATFDSNAWQVGESGFFFGAPFPHDGPRTPWPAEAPELWLRTTVTLSACDLPQVMFWARWDETMTVYVNGVAAVHERGWTSDYRYLGLSAQARAALREGENVIAVHVDGALGAKYFDLGLARFGALASRPVSGTARTPTLARYGEAVRQFMIEHGIPAGVLAVMKRDQVVVAQGFGWLDKAFTRALPHDAVLRLASNDKLFTLASARTLVDDGTIDPVTGETVTLDTPVFPLLRAHGLTPIPGATPDPAVDLVTVQQLMQHRAGLQELPPSPAQFYADLQRAPGTTTARDNVRWVYSQPLLFPPGSDDRYSSSGYMALRHLVASVHGDLLGHLRDVVLAPVGTRDVFLAHERLAARSPREPWYATFVAPYDRWIYLEDYTALASSAEALVRLLRGYHLGLGTRLIDPVTGAWSAGSDNGGGIFFGAYEGTWSMALQRRWDEVNIAVIFNLVGAYDGIYEQLDAITDTIPDAEWGTQ